MNIIKLLTKMYENKTKLGSDLKMAASSQSEKRHKSGIKYIFFQQRMMIQFLLINQIGCDVVSLYNAEVCMHYRDYRETGAVKKGKGQECANNKTEDD